MNYCTRILLPVLLACIFSPCARAADTDDPLFHAMQDELDRSMNRLVIGNMARPYYLSYLIGDDERLSIEARYNALVKSQRTGDRYLYLELRVGDSTLDNTNFVGNWGDFYRWRKDLPDENDYAALRHRLWLYTDQAYKSALEQLARKKAYLQTHPEREPLPDFASAERLDHADTPAHLTANESAWEAAVKSAAETLRDFPLLQDWKVTYTAQATSKRYLNSEGRHDVKSATMQELEVTTTAQAADGQRLTTFRRFPARDADNPPQGSELTAAVRKMAQELETAAKAPALDEYSGPVLFSDYAAAQLISQMFVSQLSLSRSVLASEDWMNQYLPVGKLAERVNRRILPEFMSIVDDPQMTERKGHRLLGSQVVDDQGVPSRAITLVKDGRLMTLPSTREPTKMVKTSNGHARILINQWTVPTVTNLFVKSDKALPNAQLVEKLRKLAEESGNEYGLLVTLLEDAQVAQDYSWMESSQDKPPLLTSPLIMFKVYAKDGRIEPVRGLVFDEVAIRSLRDVVATGKDEQVFGLMQPSVIPQVQYPVSIETPSILIEEMELKSNPAHEPQLMSTNPLHEN